MRRMTAKYRLKARTAMPLRGLTSICCGSTVPVIETGIGICHVYVDRAADVAKAVAIAVNAKTHRPSVCNAAETLLVHEDLAGSFLPKALTALHEAGVVLHAGDRAEIVARSIGVPFEEASEADFDTEWHSLEMNVRVVDDLDAAIDHIARHGSGHTEAIITEDRAAARRFVAEVDAVYRRRRVRLRRGDRDLDPEVARSWPNGAA